MSSIFGIPVVVTDAIKPDIPTPGEDARRIVRHRMHKLAPWLRFDVGPKPGEATYAVYVAQTNSLFGGQILMSPELEARLFKSFVTHDSLEIAALHRARTEYLLDYGYRDVPVRITGAIP